MTEIMTMTTITGLAERTTARPALLSSLLFACATRKAPDKAAKFEIASITVLAK